jgi:endonuclease YncB( thermonuclease family)
MHRILLLIVPALFIVSCDAQKEEPKENNEQTAFVSFIIDGDTIDTDKGRVRLVGVDAPEVGRCGSDTATEHLRTLIHKKTVALIPDALQEDRDDYDRLLRYVEFEGQDVGILLLESGSVKAFPWIDSERLNVYKEIESDAKSKGIGLWGCE